jgi:E3 ubiquitin-protein ligase ZSWIM2
MGFVVKEDGQQKTFTVLLGDSHRLDLFFLCSFAHQSRSCTCPTFQREKELCVHILWIMLKKLRMSPGDPLVFQLSYVEREIQMILQGAVSITITEKLTHIGAARSSRPVAEIKKAETPDPGGKHEREARPLDEDDVCPICQDELLGFAANRA